MELMDAYGIMRVGSGDHAYYTNYGYFSNYYLQQILETGLYHYFRNTHVGAGLATTIGAGNFLTRNYRQKIMLDNNYTMPTYVPSGLTNYKRKGMSKPKSVSKKQSKAGAQKAAKNRPNKKAEKVAKRVAKKSIAVVNQQIKELRKAVGIQLSKHCYKRCDAAGITANTVGKCAHTLIEPVTPTLLETYMANLRFFNPSAPSTLVTADYSAGTYSKDVTVKNIHSKLVLTLTNNAPARVRVYLCKAKRDTSQTPIADYTAAIADQVTSASVDTTSALLYITDLERVRENWEIDCVVDKTFVNGHTEEVSYNTGTFSYDPSVRDTETLTYQRRWKAFAWVIRLEGVLGHDTTSPNARTTLNVEGLDYEHFIKADFEYDSGTQLNDFYLVDNRSTTATAATTITGVPVVSDNMASSYT